MPPQTAPNLLVAARTDPGCDPAKAVNEDAYLATRRPDATLLVVCDGMGGHEGGRVASNTATQVLKSLFEASMPATGHARYLRQLVETAGRAVHALASGDESELRPGCTCVAMLFTSTGAAIAHAGDSRAYMLRSGVIERLTQDHSVINDLVMAGIMSPTDAKNHPDAHRITRALGMSAQVVVDVREMQDVRTSDQFLLFGHIGLHAAPAHGVIQDMRGLHSHSRQQQHQNQPTEKTAFDENPVTEPSQQGGQSQDQKHVQPHE